MVQKVCEIEDKYYCLVILTWTFRPISEDFDDRGNDSMAASRAVNVSYAHFTDLPASDGGGTA